MNLPGTIIRVFYGLVCFSLLALTGCEPYLDQTHNSHMAYECGVHQSKRQMYVSRGEMANYLIKQGLHLVQSGERTQIFIPINFVFKPTTAQWAKVKPAPKALLADVAKFIRSYEVIQVNVVTSMKGSRSNRFLNAITKRQSQKVAEELLHHGIDTRLLITSGAPPKQFKYLKGGDLRKRRNTDIAIRGYVVIDFRYLHHYQAL